jgi:general secretion pathway protein B
MSFILDALKKSESDRQRQSGPSLFEVKVAPPRRRLPIWAVAIALLLAINLIVICWMLLRHPSVPAQAAAAGESSPNAAAPVVARAAPAAAPVAAPAGGEAAPVATPGGRAAEGSPREDAASGPGSRPPATVSPPSPPPASAADRAEQAAGTPSDYAPAVEPAASPRSAASTGTGSANGLAIYQQIVNSANLPSLHLDLHVYADRPKDRFAMINMHRVTEGDSLPNGVQVDAIRPDGVALSYHGTRFLLPRN